MDIGQTGRDIMESDSSESDFEQVDQDEYDVDYIIGKRIRYGGVSNFNSIHWISTLLCFIATNVDFESKKNRSGRQLNKKKGIFMILIKFRLNTASNGKTTLKKKAHGNRNLIYRASSYWMNMKNYTQTALICLNGIRCRLRLWN